MRLLIMGPPGSGKGTQSNAIAEHYDIPTVATGEIFRRHIKESTELGQQIQELIARGEFVPDEVTEAIVEDRLTQPDAAQGFLLDGFPRTLHQVEALDAFLTARGERLNAALRLMADEDEIVRRLLRRAEVEGRSDDNEATIRHRQALYLRETAPIIEEYRKRGILVEVDALGPVEEVRRRIREALDASLQD